MLKVHFGYENKFGGTQTNLGTKKKGVRQKNGVRKKRRVRKNLGTKIWLRKKMGSKKNWVRKNLGLKKNWGYGEVIPVDLRRGWELSCFYLYHGPGVSNVDIDGRDRPCCHKICLVLSLLVNKLRSYVKTKCWVGVVGHYLFLHYKH